MNKVLLLNPAKCDGCRNCEAGCSMIKDGESNSTKSRLRVVRFPEDYFFFPLVCLQCATPYCALPCPTGAITLVDGLPVKCDLCDGDPICVKVCEPKALLESCRTNEEGIYAAGDVAEAIDRVTGKPQVTATWPNAIEQGWVAGLNMAGRKSCRLRNARSNVFTLLDLTCASMGVIEAEGSQHEEVTLRVEDSYRKLVFEGDSLVGAVLVGDIEEAGILLGLIERQDRYSGLREELERFSPRFALAKFFFRPYSLPWKWRLGGSG